MPAGQVVTTAIASGDTSTPCKTFSPTSFSWTVAPNAPEYGAAGASQPSVADVTALVQRICRSPAAAGPQILSAIQGGGQPAETAVYAIFNADCPRNQGAGSDAYAAAVDAVNSGDPADEPATAAFLSNLAAAADAVGIPVCASLAVVDQSTGQVASQRTFHTTSAAGPPGVEAAPGAEAGTNASLVVTSSLGFDSTLAPVQCDVFDPLITDWVTNRSAQAYGASNGGLPPQDSVKAIQDQICANPNAAGPQLQAAVAAGGAQAQAWVYALLLGDCPRNPTALEDTYHAATEIVNPGGDPADLPAIQQWFTNLAAAADVVGIPLCASLAVVDEATGQVAQQFTFHTGSQAVPGSG